MSLKQMTVADWIKAGEASPSETRKHTLMCYKKKHLTPDHLSTSEHNCIKADILVNGGVR